MAAADHRHSRRSANRLAATRAQGNLTEIRQNDLRFETNEAEILLRAEGIDDLDDDQLDWLVTRTEGWVAALQLAVIVLGDDPSPDRLLQIAGSNMTFADYIASEVVDTASDDMRTFLFTSALLDRVNPALAQTVSGFDDAGRMLREAQQRGLFLVSLDEQGEWFRYHQLFAEAIQAEARAREPELVRSAHERAANWFEHNDDLVTALDHWCAASRPEEALRIALAAGYRLIDSGQVTSVERIIRLIPATVVGEDPHHQLDYAMLHNHIDAEVCLLWVNEAQKSIAALASPDDQLTRRYHSVRAMCCLLFGEWDEALTNASASIDPLGVGEGDAALTRRAGLHLLRAHGWTEHTNDAEKVFRTYVGSPWTDPVVRNVLAPCAWALAAALGGRIKDAERWCSRVTATAHDVALPQAAFQELMLARAMISNELADTDSALGAIAELRATAVTTFHSLRAIAEIEMALSFVTDDRFADATLVLEDLAHPHIALGPRVHDAIDRAWTELYLRTDDIANARRSAGRMRVGFWRDATLARVFLIDGQTKYAADILEPLSATSPRQEVTLLLLRAISLPEHDQQRLELLESALTAAAAEGMLQTVVNLARGVVDLVEPASSVVPDDWMHTVRRMLAKGGRGATTGRVPTLYEQPTERERVIARYLPSRLTVTEIAREIGVTPNTVKSHLKSLYRKLDVTTREDAVTTARRLGIIG